MQQVLVLNASFEPLNVTSVRRAHVLVFKGKAEVIEELDQPLHSATDTYPWPHVIRLVAYVRVPRAVQRKISRRALFARDGWRCVYCGTTAGRLTLDHVIPRSRGGESVWENVVTACAPCNHKKGNRLLEEASMELAHLPYKKGRTYEEYVGAKGLEKRGKKKWRKSVEGAQTLGFRIILGTIISGFMGMIWLGFTTLVRK